MSLGSSGLGESTAELANFELGGLGDTTPTYEFTISHDIEVSNSFGVNKAVSFVIVSAAEASQVLGGNRAVEMAIAQTIEVDQLLEFERSYSFVMSVSHNIQVSQVLVLNSPISVSISQQVFASQLFQSRFNYIRRADIVQSVQVSQILRRRDVIYAVSIVQAVLVSSKVNLQYNYSFSANIEVGNTFLSTRVTTQNFNDILTPLNIYSSIREITHNLSHLLTPLSTYNFNTEFTRTIHDAQILTDTFQTLLVVQNPATHPVVTGTPVINGKLTIIACETGQIVLPAAEFGETFAAKVETQIKRSITGKTYTYNRTNINDKFTLTWTVGIQKAYELKYYMLYNINRQFLIYFWTGEIWLARMSSNDLPLVYEGKWQGADREKTTISLEFEGRRVL